MVRDLTTGHPLKLILGFSIPLLFGNLMAMLYNMTDMSILGHALGEKALAAAGASGGVTFMLYGFFWGLACGLTIITAQRFGAQDLAGVRRSYTTGMVLTGVLAVVAAIVACLACRQLMTWSKIPQSIFNDCYVYTCWMMIGIIPTAFSNFYGCVLRALGDSRTPLYFYCVSVLLNIPLDLLFIIQFKWGMMGGAVATVLSQIFAAVSCFYYSTHHFPILKLDRKSWQITRKNIIEHIRFATPLAFQFSMIGFGIMVLSAVVNSFGDVCIAATNAGSRIQNFVTSPMFAIGGALSTFVAQNYGAKKMLRIRTGIRQTYIFLLLFTLVGTALIFMLYPQMCRLFVKEPTPELLHMLKYYIYANVSFLFVLMNISIFRNVEQSVGYTGIVLCGSIAELIARTVGAPLLASKWGFRGAFFTDALSWGAAVICLVPAYFVFLKKSAGQLKAETQNVNTDDISSVQ